MMSCLKYDNYSKWKGEIEMLQSESVSASFLIRVTLLPLNAGITITSGQWMSQSQTKDMDHHRLHLRSVQTYFACFMLARQPMKAEISDRKYASEGIVWVGIFSSDLSAFISQPGQRDWSSVRISDISILWWNERESWEHGDWQPGYRIHSHTGTVWGRGWCSTVSLHILYIPSKKNNRWWFQVQVTLKDKL